MYSNTRTEPYTPEFKIKPFQDGQKCSKWDVFEYADSILDAISFDADKADVIRAHMSECQMRESVFDCQMYFCNSPEAAPSVYNGIYDHLARLSITKDYLVLTGWTTSEYKKKRTAHII